MPEFPRTSSQRALTTQQPAAFRQDADYRKDAAANTEITRRALEVATAIAIKWDDALVTSQLNSFKAQKGIILADIKSRAALDPDQNNAEIYLKELDDYSKKAFDGMSERAKNDASIELATDVEMAKIQVGGIFQKKVIAQAKLGLTTALEGSVKDILSTFNPAETQKKMFEAYTMIQRNVTDSITSLDDGDRLKIKFDEDVRVGLIDRDLYSDPATFKKNIKNYEFKDEKEKSDKLAKANDLVKAEKKKREWEEQQINTAGAYDLSNALLGGTLTHADIVDMHNKGMIDSETAAIFDEVIVNGEYEIADSTKTGLPEFYIRLLDESLDDKTEALTIMKQAAKSYGSGGMGKNQYAYFINEAKVRFDKQKQGKSWGNKVLKGAVDGIKEWAKNIEASVSDTALYLKNLIDKTLDGEEPNGVAENIIRQERINKYPWIKNISPDGERRMFPDGVIRKVYPDGRIEDSK